MAEAGWSAQELARMQNAGKGCLAEEDGRCFMALLDMCHFLVDQITQVHNFKDIEESETFSAAAPADEKPPEEAVEASVVSLKEENAAEVE